MPAATAASKSTSQAMPASTGEPGGNAPAPGVSPTASVAAMGPPLTRREDAPDTSVTVHASGSAAAVAAFCHELARTGGDGKLGGGTGEAPAGVAAAGWAPALVGVIRCAIHAARAGS